MLRTWVAAHKRAVTEQGDASTRVPTAQFVPLQLAGPHATAATPDIVIEIRRGAATITIRWPHSSAAECADWLHGWLR